MDLSKAELQQLHQAFMDAFPDYSALKLMVGLQLGESLDAIHKGGKLASTVLDLISWARATGRLGELIVGAAVDNPSNPELVAVSRKLLKNMLPGAIRFQVAYAIAGDTNATPTAFSNPTVIARGERLALRYKATNDHHFEIPVWLGANLSVGDKHFANVHEDAISKLSPGTHQYNRWLTISPTWPIGQYNLKAQIWYGPRSNPKQSIVLSSIGQEPSIRIK